MLALSGSPLAPPSSPDTCFAPDAVWPQGSVHTFARDAAIFAEGDPARSWYRLLSGSLRVFRVLRDGRRHVSDFVFPGQFFGFEPGAVHIHGAEAIEPASVVAYSCDRIEQRLAQDSAARQAIRKLLMDHLAQAQERIMLLGRLNATGRLAAFLLVMAQRRSKANPLGFVADLPMSRVDIADYLGLTVETVSRLFTALRGRGVVRLATPNRIEILAPAVLEAESAGTVEAEAEAELPRCA
jgi:CRP/FNR family nitrogen fixation transcriptional regulator